MGHSVGLWRTGGGGGGGGGALLVTVCPQARDWYCRKVGWHSGQGYKEEAGTVRRVREAEDYEFLVTLVSIC